MADITDDNIVYGPTATVHLGVMAYLWGPAINIAIFFAMYRYRTWWVFIHAISGAFATLFTMASSLPLLVQNGIISDDSPFLDDYPLLDIHFKIGLTCVIVISIQFLLGLLTLLLQLTKGRSIIIFNMKKIHAILGYALIILFKSNTYVNLGTDDPDFAWLLVQDILVVILIVLKKTFLPKMQEKIKRKVNEECLTEVQSVTDLDPSIPYAVFANYIYDITSLIRFHPAGFQVV